MHILYNLCNLLQLSHAIWTKFVSHEQTPETLKRKLRLREMVHNYIRVSFINFLHLAFDTFTIGFHLESRAICLNVDFILWAQVCRVLVERVVTWTCA